MPQVLPTAVSSNLAFQDFYSTTLKYPLASTDTDVYVNKMPLVDESFLVIDAEGDNPEIIFFNEVGGDYVRCPSATDGEGRGVFDTSRQDWDADVDIGMYSVAAFFEAIVQGRAIRAGAVMPTGTMVPYAGSVAPSGWLVCDGSSVLQADYADLYAVVATNYGPGDATHFTIPDMRGRTPLGSGARTWALSFLAAAVTTATDQITITANNNAYTGKAVVLSTTSSAPAGLTAATTYYLIVVDSTHIKLATTLANAIAGTAIDITTQGSGTHTLTFTGTNHILAETGGEDNHALTVAEIPSHTHTTHAATSQGAHAAGALGATELVTDIGSSATGGSTAHNILNPYLSLNYIIKT